MSTHSRLSPSSAHRWMKCPASPREEEKYPNTSGKAAVDGTHTHTLLETCINMGLSKADDFLNQTLSDDEGEFNVLQDRIDRVNVALDYIQSRFNELLADKVSISILAERKVNPGLGRDDLKGTCDLQIITPDFIEIIDYKDGMGPVSAVENYQLILYALGAVAEHPTLRHPEASFRVKMTIIQPKLELKGMKPITSWTITSDDLRKFGAEIKMAAAATDNQNAPHVAGDHCKWCKHTACSARVQDAMDKSGVAFENLDLAQQFADRESTSLTDEQLREIIEAAPMIKQVIENAELEALRRFEAGKVVPGLKIVRGRGSRSWLYDEDEMAEKLRRMGVPKADLYINKLVSPAQVAKLKWTKKSKGEEVQKQLSDRQLRALENEYIKKSEGKLTVVMESDHRKAVMFDAAPMFGSVNEDQEDGLPAWLK